MDKRAQEKQSEEYRNFAELTKNLIAVPKKEVDQEKAKYERSKDRKKKPIK